MSNKEHNANWYTELRKLDLSKNNLDNRWELKQAAIDFFSKDEIRKLPPEVFNKLLVDVKTMLLNQKIETKIIANELENKKKLAIETSKSQTWKLDNEIKSNNEGTFYLLKSLEATRDEIRDNSKWNSVRLFWFWTARRLNWEGRYLNEKDRTEILSQLDKAIAELNKNKNLSWAEAYRILERNLKDKWLIKWFYSLFNKDASWNPNAKKIALDMIESNVWEAQMSDVFKEEMADTFLQAKQKLSPNHLAEIDAKVDKQMTKAEWQIKKAAREEWKKNSKNIMAANPEIKYEIDLIALYRKLYWEYIKSEMVVKYTTKYIIWEKKWIPVPDDKKEIWARYKSALDAKDEWTKFSLKWEQQLIGFMVYDMPAMLISGWLAGATAKLGSWLLLRWVAGNARLQRIAWLTIETSELAWKVTRTVETTTRRWKLLKTAWFIAEKWIEWTVFTAAHSWIRNQEWFLNSPEWWKEILTNSLMFWSFGVAEKLVNKIYMRFPTIGTRLLEKKAIDWLIKQWLTWPALYYSVNRMLPPDLNAFSWKEINEIWQELALMSIMWASLHFASPTLEKIAWWYTRLKVKDFELKINEQTWKWEVVTEKWSIFSFDISWKIKEAWNSLKNKRKAKKIRKQNIEMQSQIKKQQEIVWKLEEDLQNAKSESRDADVSLLTRQLNVELKKLRNLKINKAINKSKVSETQIRENANLSPEERIKKAEELLWKEFNQEQKTAILEMHNAWFWVFENTVWKLRTKAKINRQKVAEYTDLETKKVKKYERLFTEGELRILMENWILWDNSSAIKMRWLHKVLWWEYSPKINHIFDSLRNWEDFVSTIRSNWIKVDNVTLRTWLIKLKRSRLIDKDGYLSWLEPSFKKVKNPQTQDIYNPRKKQNRKDTTSQTSDNQSTETKLENMDNWVKWNASGTDARDLWKDAEHDLWVQSRIDDETWVSKTPKSAEESAREMERLFNELESVDTSVITWKKLTSEKLSSLKKERLDRMAEKITEDDIGRYMYNTILLKNELDSLIASWESARAAILEKRIAVRFKNFSELYNRLLEKWKWSWKYDDFLEEEVMFMWPKKWVLSVDPVSSETWWRKFNPLPYVWYAAAWAWIMNSRREDINVDPTKFDWWWATQDISLQDSSQTPKSDWNGNASTNWWKGGDKWWNQIPVQSQTPNSNNKPQSQKHSPDTHKPRNKPSERTVIEKNKNLWKDLKYIYENKYKELEKIWLWDAFFWLDKWIELDENPIYLDYDWTINWRITVNNKWKYVITLTDDKKTRVEDNDLFEVLTKWYNKWNIIREAEIKEYKKQQEEEERNRG